MRLVDEENENDGVDPIDIEKEKRKRYNKRYYEKTKRRRIANGEGTSQHSTPMTNTTFETTQGDNNDFESVAQKTSTYNREYYQRRKEQNMIRRSRVSILPEDPYDFVYDDVPMNHRVLKARNLCVYCGAKRLQYEFPTFCCMSGKTRLAYSPIPTELHRLFTKQGQLEQIFRYNIRAYNSNFSFTSMGVKLDEKLANMTSGVYTFRAHGTIYHNIDQLVPRDGQPRYLQLYFYDGELEISQRHKWPNVDREIIKILTQVLASNPYVRTFRRLSNLESLDNYRVTLNASVELDQRVYNQPTTFEVAAIWVEGNDNITAYKRSVIVYGRSNYYQEIEPHFGCYDPLAYPLFFPNGEYGWHPKIPRHGVSIDEIINDNENIEEGSEESNGRQGRKTVTMREYYSYKFQIRPHEKENVILLGKRLFQQFAVDTYIKIETARLDFCERNQDKIRAELYQGFVDCFNAGEGQASMVGKRVVFPASFIGGPRDMRRRFLDAMALVQDDGRPDIFLTMTCNPKWKEIDDELLPGQTAQDRPDLVARVFRAKLEDLKEQLFKKHIIGEVGAYVCDRVSKVWTAACTFPPDNGTRT